MVAKKRKTVGKVTIRCKCQVCGKMKTCKHQLRKPPRWINACGKCRKSNRHDLAVRSV